MGCTPKADRPGRALMDSTPALYFNESESSGLSGLSDNCAAMMISVARVRTRGTCRISVTMMTVQQTHRVIGRSWFIF